MPRITEKKKTLSRNSFLINLNDKNNQSNVHQNFDFIENESKPYCENDDNSKNSFQKNLLPPLKNSKTKKNFLEKTNTSNSLMKLPQINHKQKNLSAYEIQINNPQKHERDFSNTLFLTSNNENLNNFPNKDLRDDLLASMQNIERMLKTPIIQDRKKVHFQRIYNQDEIFLNDLKKRKKEKSKLSLMQYQNNLMDVISKRMSDDNLRSLSMNLKKIREKNETVQPLKINWNEYNKILKNLNKLKNKSKNIFLICF